MGNIANVPKRRKVENVRKNPPFLEWCVNTGTGRREVIDTIMRERMNKIVIALPGKKLRTRNRTADRLMNHHFDDGQELTSVQ